MDEGNFNLTLEDNLQGFKKAELTRIRRRFEIPGISQLNKAELKEALVEMLPEYLDNWVAKMIRPTCNVVWKFVEQGKIDTREKINSMFIAEELAELGLVGEKPGGDEVYLMPEEIRKEFREAFDDEMQEIIELNTFIVSFITTHLFYYGIIPFATIRDKINNMLEINLKSSIINNVIEEHQRIYGDIKKSRHVRSTYLYHEIIDRFKGRFEGPGGLFREVQDSLDYYPLKEKEIEYVNTVGSIPWPAIRELKSKYLDNYFELGDDHYGKVNLRHIGDRLFFLFNTGFPLDYLTNFLVDEIEQQGDVSLNQVEIREIKGILDDFRQEAHCWLLKGHSVKSKGEEYGVGLNDEGFSLKWDGIDEDFSEHEEDFSEFKEDFSEFNNDGSPDLESLLESLLDSQLESQLESQPESQLESTGGSLEEAVEFLKGNEGDNFDWEEEVGDAGGADIQDIVDEGEMLGDVIEFLMEEAIGKSQAGLSEEEKLEQLIEVFFELYGDDIFAGVSEGEFEEEDEERKLPTDDFLSRMEREIDPQWSLEEMLVNLTKDELTRIRWNYEISGISQLNKGELAEVLAAQLPGYLIRWLNLITGDLLEYLQAFLSPAGQAKFVQVPAEYRPENIVNVRMYQYLQERGILFVGRYQGDLIQVMPEEIEKVLTRVENKKYFQQRISTNNRLVNYTLGQLFYCGVLEDEKLFELVDEWFDFDIDREYYFLLLEEWRKLNPVFEKYEFGHRGIFYSLAHVEDPLRIVEEQENRREIEYYRPTKSEIEFAANNYIPREAKKVKGMKDFLKRKHIELDNSRAMIDVKETDFGQILYNMINNTYEKERILTELQVIISGMREEDTGDLLGIISDFHNSIPHWALKGHSPDDVFRSLS